MTTATRAATPSPASSPWAVYQMMFSDHLESVNAAPRTIQTYALAVQQLGDFLRAQGMPHDPTLVTRGKYIEWLRYLQRPRGEGGQGVSAATALQRYRSHRPILPLPGGDG